MDKYENNLKLDQMKALAAGGDYASAAEIADAINWRRVRNVSSLVKAGDIYARQKRYDEAKEILLMAYDRSHAVKMIVYRLAKIAIKMNDLEEAEEYYNEFVEIAPQDNLKYELRFKLSRAKGEDLPAQIAVLEELKEAEYTEEWAYRLAFLYHKAGEVEKCIDTCDELILWFGDGIYVERALELKMHHQPLTKSQESKYRALKQHENSMKEMQAKEENIIRIPVVQESVERYNTANLQEELAKSMQQIMEATKQETVDDTRDSIKKLVDEIPYLRAVYREREFEAKDQIDASLRDNFKEMMSSEEEDTLSGWEKTRRAAQAALMMAQQQKLEASREKALIEAQEIMERLADMIPKLDAGITPTQMLQEEYLQADSSEEMALRAVADMNDMLQQQIDRLQEEVLEEEMETREEMQESAEIEFEPESEPEPELLRKIRQAKPNFDEQIGLRPYHPRQFTQTEENNLEEDKLEENIPKEDISDRSLSENGLLETDLPEIGLPEGEFSEEELSEGGFSKERFLKEGFSEEELSEEKFLEKGFLEEGFSEEELSEGGFSKEGFSEKGFSKEGFLEEELSEEELSEEEFLEKEDVLDEKLSEEMRLAEAEFYGRSLDDTSNEALPEDRNTEENSVFQSAILKQDTKEIKPGKIAKALKQQAETLGEWDKPPEEPEEAAALSSEQKKLFSCFLPVAGMEEQIGQTLAQTSKRLAEGKRSAEGNILIQGGHGCGKTALAVSIVKALQKEAGYPEGKVGKIDARALNQKDLAKLFKKLAGGCLIIEKASELNRETAVRLSLLLENDESGILLIMGDTRTGLEEALSRDEKLAEKFTERIKIPVFTSDELVEFGKEYARSLKYEIDNMGVLALYNRISNIQRLDQATTLAEIKEIVDGAIENAEKGGIKKALSIITSRRYTEDDYVILREKDFEE